MLDMIKTLANGILEQVKSFRGDWNVNDISSPHYIKNRTHYTEKKYVDVLSQKTFTGDSLKLKTPLKKGKSYLVEFNGVQYKCTAKEYDGCIVIGNNAIYEWDDGNETDTGEPFAFECEKDEPYLVVALADTVTEPPTIHITTEEEIVHKLDKKYLPEIPSIGKSSGGKNSEIFNDYDNNATDGDYSHAEGYSTAVLANYGHTEGWTTFVDAEAAHAEGWSTYGGGRGAHAEGNQSSARGDYSHAEGFETFADGKGSHSEGHYTFASGEYQHVQGRFNIDDVDDNYEPLNKYAHIVGNGTDYSERSNAHTIDWDGNAWFAGDVYVNSTSGTNMDEGSKKLVTEDKLSDYYLKTEADTLHSELHDYVDTEVTALVNAAPETLDTLGELAAAFNENKEVVEALDASITNKVDKSYLSEFENELKAYVVEAIYGIVDGTIENISNTKATYVRDYGFYKHPSLISASFTNATKIGDYGFYQSPALSTVEAPLVAEIGAFAFRGCSSLTNITSSAVTITGNGAFDECTNLSSVALANLQEVKPLTFRKCESLTTVDLPVATNIGTQAFYSSGVTSLTLRSNTVVILENADAFYFTPIEEGTGYIYVPSNLVNSYKTADGWLTYANQIRAIA